MEQNQIYNETDGFVGHWVDQPVFNSLWNDDTARERTFDEAANDVFSKVIGNGFYTDFLKGLPKALK